MVNIYKLKLTILQEEILRYLFIKAGSSMNARALSLALNVSQPAISKALPFLEKKEFIKVTKDKESKRLSILLNSENPLIIGMKRADNLLQLYECGLISFLYNKLPGITVIMFGSYANGEDTVTSDIDIATIGSYEKELDLADFEARLGRKINAQSFRSLKDIDRHLLNNILNGITLKGAVEL